MPSGGAVDVSIRCRACLRDPGDLDVYELAKDIRELFEKCTEVSVGNKRSFAKPLPNLPSSFSCPDPSSTHPLLSAPNAGTVARTGKSSGRCAR